MKYVLDTNVCIRILKGAPAGMLKRMAAITTEQVAIPTIVRFELFYGAYKSNKQKETLRLLNDFLKPFMSVDFDEKAAMACGKIRAELDIKGTPIGPYDLMIAAITLSSGFTLVTHNVKEFSRIENLKISDWES
jgi:tRNA(fMet)-specific endonuclease VapC